MVKLVESSSFIVYIYIKLSLSQLPHQTTDMVMRYCVIYFDFLHCAPHMVPLRCVTYVVMPHYVAHGHATLIFETRVTILFCNHVLESNISQNGRHRHS